MKTCGQAGQRNASMRFWQQVAASGAPPLSKQHPPGTHVRHCHSSCSTRNADMLRSFALRQPETLGLPQTSWKELREKRGGTRFARQLRLYNAPEYPIYDWRVPRKRKSSCKEQSFRANVQICIKERLNVQAHNGQGHCRMAGGQHDN